MTLLLWNNQSSKGHGATLIKNIIYANRKNGNCVHLDSSVVRHNAHKFYFENDFDIVTRHLLFKLI